MLSIEKAKSVTESKATTRRNLKLFGWISTEDSTLSISELKITLEKNK